MKNVFKGALGIALASLTLAAAPVTARADMAGIAAPDSLDVGVLLGVVFPSSAGRSSRFEYGAEVDTPIVSPFNVGAYVFNSSKDEIGVSVRYTQFGIQGRYIFDSIPGLGLGPRLGFVNTDVSVNNSSNSGGSTNFELGPFVTYDYMFAPNWSVGGDGSIMFVTASDSYNLFSLLATLKYHF